jgi:hypothetical protein
MKAKVAVTVLPAAALTLAAALAPMSHAVAAMPDCRSDPFYEQKVLNGEPFFGCVLNGVPQGSYSAGARGLEGPIAANRGGQRQGSGSGQAMKPADIFEHIAPIPN